jgi:hypothetical protein
MTEAQRILEYLDKVFGIDEADAAFYFGGANSAICDARLSVFRSDVVVPTLRHLPDEVEPCKPWAIVIELVSCFIASQGFDHMALIYGNFLEEPYVLERCWSLLFSVCPDLPYDKDYQWLADASRFCIYWRGRRWEFTPSREDYEKAGLVLSSLGGEGSLRPHEMMRFLCYAMDHPFFMTEEVLREKIMSHEKQGYSPVTPYLHLVLQTYEWEHPGAGTFREGEDVWVFRPGGPFQLVAELVPKGEGWVPGPERPSEVETFQVIAEIISTGDVSLWEKVDREKFNVTWKGLEKFWMLWKYRWGDI